jgi:hypothetical protein
MTQTLYAHMNKKKKEFEASLGYTGRLCPNKK